MAQEVSTEQSSSGTSREFFSKPDESAFSAKELKLILKLVSEYRKLGSGAQLKTIILIGQDNALQNELTLLRK
ncbi:MAG: hypothetical protein ACYDBW_01655 [Sulfuricaulis sp.]